MTLHEQLLAAEPHRYYPLGATGSGIEQWQSATGEGGVATTAGGAVLASVAGRTAVALDGVDDEILIPSFWEGGMDAEIPMTIVMMVYVPSLTQFLSNNMKLFEFSAAAPSSWSSDAVSMSLGPYNSGQIFELASSAKSGRGYGCYLRQSNVAPLFTAGRWTMLALQFQGAVKASEVVRRVWVCGELWYDSPVNINYVSMPSTAMLGRIGRGIGSVFLNGAISALAIYKRLLSADEIKSIAQAADLYRPFCAGGIDELSANRVSDSKLDAAWDASYSVTAFKAPPFVIGTPGVADLPSGVKRLAGVLTRNGTPSSIPYRVYRRSDGVLIKTGISAADGTYSVTGIPDVPCYLIALDPQDEFNAGVLDRLQPEA